MYQGCERETGGRDQVEPPGVIQVWDGPDLDEGPGGGTGEKDSLSTSSYIYSEGNHSWYQNRSGFLLEFVFSILSKNKNDYYPSICSFM